MRRGGDTPKHDAGCAEFCSGAKTKRSEGGQNMIPLGLRMGDPPQIVWRACSCERRYAAAQPCSISREAARLAIAAMVRGAPNVPTHLAL